MAPMASSKLSISLTLDTYGHLLPVAEKEAITGVMASILSNPG